MAKGSVKHFLLSSGFAGAVAVASPISGSEIDQMLRFPVGASLQAATCKSDRGWDERIDRDLACFESMLNRAADANTYTGAAAVWWRFEALPDFVVDRRAAVELLNGRLQRISFEVAASRSSDVLAALTAKFGLPTSRQPYTLPIPISHSVPAQYIWLLDGRVVYFLERRPNSKAGVVMISKAE